MQRHLIAAILLLALAGLCFVQFRLLVIGARLEKQRFDQQLLVAQGNIRQALNEPGVLSDALVFRLRQKEARPLQPDYLLDSLQIFLHGEMARAGISPRFSFAITPRHSQDVLFKSKNFDLATFQFDEYPVLLGDYFPSRLHSEFVLHLDLENLFGYLLGELDYLVIPSVGCLLAMLACLAFLLHILRREERLNTVKNDFINNLTHELKTPAFGISLAGKLARDNLEKGNPGKVLEFLQIIENEKDKLVAHAEKVLQLASLESGEQHFRKEKTDVNALVSAAVEAFRPAVAARQGSLSANLGAAQNEAPVDPDHFKNALQNLLDNALKYSPGAPVIEVATMDAGPFFQVTVSDRGVGIPPSERRRVFDKFYRISTGDLHDVKGFGLGLSYVRQVARAHGGKVEVAGREGGGAVFKFAVRQSSVRQSPLVTCARHVGGPSN